MCCTFYHGFQRRLVAVGGQKAEAGGGPAQWKELSLQGAGAPGLLGYKLRCGVRRRKGRGVTFRQ